MMVYNIGNLLSCIVYKEAVHLAFHPVSKRIADMQDA